MKALIKQIEIKLSPALELQNRVNNLFDDLIDHISDVRDSLI